MPQRKPKPATKLRDWKLVEVVVHILEIEYADGASVTYDARLPDLQTGDLRQVDLLVDVEQAGRLLRRMVEVRDRGRPVGVEYIDEVQTKQRRVGAHRATIVSKRGFYDSSVRRLREDEHTIDGVELRKSGWPDWFNPRSFTVEGKKYQLESQECIDIVNDVFMAQVVYADTSAGVVCLVIPPGGRAPDSTWWLMTHENDPDPPLYVDLVLKFHNADGMPQRETFRAYRGSSIRRGEPMQWSTRDKETGL